MFTALATLLVAGIACKNDDASEPTRASLDEAEARPLDAASLRPIIRPAGSPGVAPERVVVEFLRPLGEPAGGARDTGMNTELVPEVEGETVLVFEPEVQGESRMTSPTTLEFVPTEGFLPNQTYTARLQSVATAAGTLTPPSRDAWTTSFAVPPLAFLGASVYEQDAERDRVALLLRFSGPIRVDDVDDHLTIKGRNGQLTVDEVRATDKPHEAMVSMRLDPDRIPAISVYIESGVRSWADRAVRAGAGSDRVLLDPNPDMEILHTYAWEGSATHSIKVICNDQAVESQRWHYARGEWSGQVSDRCQLASIEDIVIEPPVSNVVLSPSRAGFSLIGPFDRGSYSLRFREGARTLDGGTLARDYEAVITVPAMSEVVRFPSKGRYLPQSAWTRAAVQFRNAEQIIVEVRHVPAENLLFWLTGGSEQADARTSNLIATHILPVQGKPDVLETAWLDVAEMVPERQPGLYEVTVRTENARDATRVLITDLQLVAKAARESGAIDNVHVWAFDSHKGHRLSNAKLELVRASGTVLDSCSTTSQGCVLQVPDDIDPAPPVAIRATHRGDLTILPFADLQTPVSDYDVQGEPFDSNEVYRAALYTDRGVYRPGDLAHIAAVVREDGAGAPKAGLPVVLEIADSRAKLTRKVALTTNEAGFVTDDLELAPYAATGQYTGTLYAGEEVVGQVTFGVEEFVPERLKVTVEPKQSPVVRGQAVTVDIQADYLFGGGAADSRFELNCRLHLDDFKPATNKQLAYGPHADPNAPKRPLVLGSVTGTLDESGHTTATCPPAPGGGFNGPAAMETSVAVFEAGSGRSTHGHTSVSVLPGKVLVGLASDRSKVSAGEAINIIGTLVDWQGNAVSEAIEVEIQAYILETEWSWVYDEEDGSERYGRVQRRRTEGPSRTVAAKAGRFQTTITPSGNGHGLLVQATLPDGTMSELYLQGKSRYWWQPWDSQVDSTPRPAKPTAIEVVAPEQIRVNEKATAHFVAPYEGRALFSIEADEVVHTEWREVKAGEQSFDFKLTEFVPNVYASVVVFKDPHLESKESYLPDRAFGVAPIRIEPEAFTRNVKLGVPKEVRSHDTLTITLDLGPGDGPTYATVAAVDAGILSLTNFETPNPVASLFPKRALGVDTFETVGWTLMVAPHGNSSHTGGDAPAGLGRIQMVEPVSLWSGLVEVPASGKATVELQVPQYQGALRVMAVVADPVRSGHADATVLVRDPIVLQTTVPRFLTHNDTFQVPVFVTNTAGKAQEVTVEIEAKALPIAGFEGGPGDEPPIAFTGAHAATFLLEDGASHTVAFEARANRQAGAAQITVKAQSGSHASRETLTVPFAPNGPRSRKVTRLEVKEGNHDLSAALAGWVPTTERTTFWVTTNPYGEALGHLKHVVRYPYGCIEQTTSSTRPLLFVRNLIGAQDPEILEGKDIDDMVMHGVKRVLGMQTPSGGFAYWPGGTEPNWWGTAYATHLLVDAKELGYDVPAERLDSALDFIEDRVSDDGANGSHAAHAHMKQYGEPYLHFVLAQAGRGKKARIQKLIDKIDRQSKDGATLERLYLLRAALYLAGDRRYEGDLRDPPLLSQSTNKRKNDWSFYSDLRRRGLTLSIHQDLFGTQDAGGNDLAWAVFEGLRGSSSARYTTQELVWGVTGLGKRAIATATSFDPPQLRLDGKVVAGRSGTKDAGLQWSVNRASELRSVELDVASIEGDAPLYLLVNSEGVRSNASWSLGGNGLQVEREFLNNDGSLLDWSTHKLGDLIYVRVRVKNELGQDVQNLALVDRLPAGWEIENPRLGRDTEQSWIETDKLWSADHMNLRDDRLELFGGLANRESREVIYAVRAVTSGTFTIPPVSVEAMYNPDIWARAAGRQITIAGPWSEVLL